MRLPCKIVSVEKKDIHCGTVRVTIAHDYSNREVEGSVWNFISIELGSNLLELGTYEKWGMYVGVNIKNLKNNINALLGDGKTIGAFGASAKGNTLLNVCGFTTEEIGYIVDDTPEKQGMFSPGTGIPIVSIDTLEFYKPDYMLILAWNFKDEIIERLKGVYNGKLIVPIPTLEIL